MTATRILPQSRRSFFVIASAIFLSLSYFPLQRQIILRMHNPVQRTSIESSFRPYHDLRLEIEATVDPSRPKSLSAYSRADVVNETTTWFRKRRICSERCCVETVAVSLFQDEQKPINFEDGRDLGDLIVEDLGRPLPDHLKFHAYHFHEDMAPCLVPGTIIFLKHNHHAV